MNAPLWFSNLAFWSVQVALLISSGGLLLRVFQIQQPRIVLVCWRVLLAISLALPFVQPWRRPRSVEAITLSSANTGAPVTHAPDATFSFWHFLSLQLAAETLGIVILVGIATRFVAEVVNHMLCRCGMSVSVSGVRVDAAMSRHSASAGRTSCRRHHRRN